MSGPTVEYQVKSQNGIKYTIHIRDFDQRTKSFRSGRYIYSKEFWIGESSFCVHIYPNGDSAENKGHIGVFLQNNSEWRVKVECTFMVVSDGCSCMTPSSFSSDKIIEPESRLGFSSFLSPFYRSDWFKGEFLDKDGVFSLEVNVKLLKSTPAYVKDIKEKQQEHAEKLEEQTQKLEIQTKKLEEQGKQIKTLYRLKEDFTAQKAEVQKLTAAMQAMASSMLNNCNGSDTMDSGAGFRAE